MVPTPSMAAILKARGFANIVSWTRGVDLTLFFPRRTKALADLPRPIALYAGRVAVEKGLPDFLDLDLPGSKVVVGDGPLLPALKARYPGVALLGYLTGEALAETLAAADVFVFPSRTDTFGLVMIEALASGVPVAAYDVPGPRDIVTSKAVGALGDDLKAAIEAALRCHPESCRRHALDFTWERSAEQFRGHLVPLHEEGRNRLKRGSAANRRRAALAPAALPQAK
jgi:glycosyltransferase involved in cell wall biosynthesis